MMKCGNYNSSFLAWAKDRYLNLSSNCTDLFCQVRQYMRDLRTGTTREDHGRTVGYFSPKIRADGVETPLRIIGNACRTSCG